MYLIFVNSFILSIFHQIFKFLFQFGLFLANNQINKYEINTTKSIYQNLFLFHTTSSSTNFRYFIVLIVVCFDFFPESIHKFNGLVKRTHTHISSSHTWQLQYLTSAQQQQFERANKATLYNNYSIKIIIIIISIIIVVARIMRIYFYKPHLLKLMFFFYLFYYYCQVFMCFVVVVCYLLPAVI